MSSLNKSMIIGNLGQDPEVRATQNGTPVANLSVATTEKYKDKQGELQERTEWHRVVAWGRLAEICRDYLKKGSKVYFEGQLQTNKWQDNDGNDRYTTEIKALNMVMLDSKGESNQAPQSQPVQNQSPANNVADEQDDDLPF